MDSAYIKKAHINDLSLTFKESPSNKPSVEIKFTGKDFPYENGLSANIVAEYSEFNEGTNLYSPEIIEGIYDEYYEGVDGENSFSSDYLASYFHDGLKNFLCPGYSEIYVKCLKTTSFDKPCLRFEFYSENPLNTNIDYFALSTCEITLNKSTENVDKYINISKICGNSDVYLGDFCFYYLAVKDDEIYDMELAKPKYFKFVLSNDNDENTWKNATLYYKDLIENDAFVEDLFNHYIVNSNGTINESINYWDLSEDIDINSGGYYCLRVKLVDTNAKKTSYCSSIITCKNGRYSTNEIANFIPVFKYDKSKDKEINPDYCISDAPNFSLIVPNKEYDYNDLSSLMQKVIYYRYAENENDIYNKKWTIFPVLDGETQFNFYMTWLGGSGTGGQVLDGPKTIYLQISDGLGNTSEIIEYSADKYAQFETRALADAWLNSTLSYEGALVGIKETDGWHVYKVEIVDEAKTFVPADEKTKSEYNKYLWTKDSIRKIELYRQAPNSIVFNVIGSSGSEYYTGMYKDENGHFIATNKILVNVYAKDNLNLPLEYQLYLGNSYDETDKTKWKKFDYPKDESTYYNIPFYLESEGKYGIFENNQSVNINLVFKNSAGLESNVITRNMFFNTTILKTDKTNLREVSNSYKPIIEYYNGDEYVNINEMENFDVTVPKRSWHEIFYPENHSFPVDETGNIDVSEALKITNENALYDAVKTETIISKDEDGKDITTKRIVYDDEQRPITIWNDYDSVKKYRSLMSNQKTYNSETGETDGLVYWIIDNTGYTDFQLEFEHFHLDQTSHIQINDLAPFKGDCLVIYDASEEGATSEYIDQYGRTAYKLVDSTKLKMLSAYSGDGVNVVQLYPEELVGSVNATSNGAFTTQKFLSTSRICLILYTDGGDGDNKSGFKIKASPARETNWINWEVDNKRGEVWLHKIDTEILEGNTFSTLTTKAGYCPDKVRMSYEYSDTSFDIDYENGTVKFYEKLDGQVWGTFCYYNYDIEKGPYIEVSEKNDEGEEVTETVLLTNTFALADDDLVDYRELSIYASYNKDGKNNINKESTYEFTEDSYGKIITNITTYKDSGLIKFENNLPPKNRMFADYYCHSYYRLTDDGYGNLYFYDDIIVPDKTDSYKDFTYVDLKIVNEGEATLRNGRIKFTFRGIATGSNATTITSVLNPDRPWDVQVGTPEETFDQVGGVVSSNYNFPEMTWNNALAIFEGTVDVDSKTKLTGGKTEIPFGVNLDMKQEIYLRIVWTMFKDGTEDSPNYITPSTAGEKCFSGEIEGSFYTIQI